MSILSFIGKIFEPAVKLVDDLTTSDEEKESLRIQLVKIENEFASKVLEYEKKLTEAQSSVVKAEATGHSWLQRNWRPITMLTFLALVVLDGFNLLVCRLPGDAWTLLQIGLGGYVVGRSAEKIIPAVAGRKKQEEAKG